MNTDAEKTAAALAHVRDCPDCQQWFQAALAEAQRVPAEEACRG